MRILIAFDGSDSAKAAIEDLGRAGLPQDVEAEVLCVADVYPHLPPECYEPDRNAGQKPAPALAKARHLASAALLEAKIDASRGAGVVSVMFPGWSIGSRVLADVPYRAIVRHAEEWKADLVVIGSQGRSAAGRAVFGSVAQKVLAYAPCSVRIGHVRPADVRSRTEPLRILIGMDNSAGAAMAVDAVANRTWPRLTEFIIATALDPQTTSALGLHLRRRAWTQPARAIPDWQRVFQRRCARSARLKSSEPPAHERSAMEHAIALEQLKQSVRAKVCATCPYRTLGTDSAAADLTQPRPCEKECPVFLALPILENVAHHVDPLVGHRPQVIEKLLRSASRGRGRAALILRRHSQKIQQAILQHFHD
ncbi:hypothetical protein BH09PLA1_BH09PLA1_00280 [soil metagenome]